MIEVLKDQRLTRENLQLSLDKLKCGGSQVDLIVTQLGFGHAQNVVEVAGLTKQVRIRFVESKDMPIGYLKDPGILYGFSFFPWIVAYDGYGIFWSGSFKGLPGDESVKE